VISADERRRKPVQITGARRSGRGPVASLCCTRLSFSAESLFAHLNDSQSFRYSVKILAGLPLLGGGGTLSPGPEPAVGGPGCDAALLGKWFPTFQTNMSPSSTTVFLNLRSMDRCQRGRQHGWEKITILFSLTCN
jgi:hypothetical protein